MSVDCGRFAVVRFIMLAITLNPHVSYYFDLCFSFVLFRNEPHCKNDVSVCADFVVLHMIYVVCFTQYGADLD